MNFKKILIVLGTIIAIIAFGGYILNTIITNQQTSSNQTVIKDTVTEGVGWQQVTLGASRKSVDNYLGQPTKLQEYDDVYFADYTSKGIQVNFNRKSDTARAIFFYNGQKDYESFTPFEQKTSKGIGFNNSEEDVINVYGKPFKDYKGEDNEWRRIMYKGIDFSFENNKMVRMSVFKTNLCDYWDSLATFCALFNL